MPIQIQIIGAGVAGLCAAHVFAARGCDVTLIAASDGPDESCCSWWAGGMLAPYCEQESAEPLMGELGAESMVFWQSVVPGMASNGTLVVAPSRDVADLRRFAERTTSWSKLGGPDIAALEPDLADRFARGLHFASEAHIDPRKGLQALVSSLKQMGVTMRFGTQLSPEELARPVDDGWRIDCRGLAARDALSDLRGVKGEMLLLKTDEITLSRPVRLLHPRIPLYIVPRADGVFMVGATSVENDQRGRATARSVLELLSGAHVLHPAFGEAELLEIGCDVRPAFADNLPRLRVRGRTLHINGLYRHGFLAAPAMARRAADFALTGRIFDEVMDEDRRQRQFA